MHRRIRKRSRRAAFPRTGAPRDRRRSSHRGRTSRIGGWPVPARRRTDRSRAAAQTWVRRSRVAPASPAPSSRPIALAPSRVAPPPPYAAPIAICRARLALTHSPPPPHGDPFVAGETANLTRYRQGISGLGRSLAALPSIYADARGGLRVAHRRGGQHSTGAAAVGRCGRAGDPGARQGGVLQPRRLGQGPHRACA